MHLKDSARIGDPEPPPSLLFFAFDRVTRIPWYRQFEQNLSGAWIIAEKRCDPICSTDKVALRTLSGGYVEKRNHSVFCFPMVVVDLKTGDHTDLCLQVPLQD